MEDELGGKQMTELAASRPKTYSYLIDNGDENKKAKGTKKRAIRRKLKCEDCKHYLEATHLKNTINNLEKSKLHVDGLKEFIKKQQINIKVRAKNEAKNIMSVLKKLTRLQ